MYWHGHGHLEAGAIAIIDWKRFWLNFCSVEFWCHRYPTEIVQSLCLLFYISPPLCGDAIKHLIAHSRANIHLIGSISFSSIIAPQPICNRSSFNAHTPRIALPIQPDQPHRETYCTVHYRCDWVLLCVTFVAIGLPWLAFGTSLQAHDSSQSVAYGSGAPAVTNTPFHTLIYKCVCTNRLAAISIWCLVGFTLISN